jgi:hypothetical protein
MKTVKFFAAAVIGKVSAAFLPRLAFILNMTRIDHVAISQKKIKLLKLWK